MRRPVVLVLLVLAIGLSSAASAHPLTVLDDDDSPGPLDIVAARLRHPRRGYVLHLRTYEPWSNSTLDGHKNYVGFEFDFDSDGFSDRCVIVRFDVPEDEGPTAIHGGVYGPGCVSELSDRPGAVSRPDDHGFTVRTPRRWIPRRNFLWRALTSYEEEGHPDCYIDIGPEPRHGSCADFTRWKAHDIR